MASSAVKLLFQGSAVAPRTVTGKLRDRLMAIVNDYKFVLREMWNDAKARPTRATIKTTTAGTALALFLSNPSLADYNNYIIDQAATLSLLSAQERNADTFALVSRAAHLAGQQRIQQLNLFVCSIMLEQEHATTLERFDAHHWTLHRTLASLPARFLDVGVAGQFLCTKEAMKHYDDPL